MPVAPPAARYGADHSRRGGGRQLERMSVKFAVGGWVCLLVGCLTSQQHASISQGRICSDDFMRCHTETEVADQLSTSPSHSILTPGRPVPALTMQRQVPGRVATGVPIFESLV